MNAPSPEFLLTLACSRVRPSEEDASAIRRILEQGIDWTAFTGRLLDHGLACLAGRALLQAVPDMIPDDIHDALRTLIDHTTLRNRHLFDELADIFDTLAANGVEAIPIKGPVLAIEAFGDVGMRTFRDLDFLIRDRDVPVTIEVLARFGYKRRGNLTAAQYDFIHRLQGQEIIFKEVVGTAIEPHTRLTSLKLELPIDYEGFWQRARRRELLGRIMNTLAPEDNFLVLAVHGGKELWRNVKWACDVAIFIESHPQLDWITILDRAKAQGCLRMALLAASLARLYFAAKLPEPVLAAERADRELAPLVERLVADWTADHPSAAPSNRKVNPDRLLLVDGLLGRARYVARTMLLPTPEFVAATPVPAWLSSAYVPLIQLHNAVALPLWLGYRATAAWVSRLRETLANSTLARALVPAEDESRPSVWRYRKVRAEARRALVLGPEGSTAWRNLGDALSGLKHYREAIACYDRALTVAPQSWRAWDNRLAALKAVGDGRALATQPGDSFDASAWATEARHLYNAKKFGEAIEASNRALDLAPENTRAMRIGIQARLFACDWSRREEDRRRITRDAGIGFASVSPLFHRAISDSEAEGYQVSSHWVAQHALPEPLWRGERYHHDKIRLAYLSTDFRDHVVPEAIIGCLEARDTSRFHLTAISLGPNDHSRMRARLEAAFDEFLEVESETDEAIARLMAERGIDIAIDLNGRSGDCRPGILAYRPAPVQVNYLGYPGTMGMPFIDYIVADRVVIPETQQVHYTERVAYLPRAMMPTDRTRRIAERTPSRAEAGLPETGFVFACQNREHKIGPEMFDIWMRLLRNVEGSVLWLKLLNPAAMRNLWREARDRGVAPERLIFAPQMPDVADHLARLRLADLFLDTLPYNAHATTCDALWAGLPVVTCLGNAFQGRVAASLLQSIGLPELVTASPAEYEELALGLARDPERLAEIKAKLRRNRTKTPLFDTEGYTRDLEAAFAVMWERHQQGLPPAAFSVTEMANEKMLP